MLGRTHISIGISTALLFLRPETMLDFGAAVAGGAIGGTICDIDLKGSDFSELDIKEDTTKDIALVAVYFIFILLFDKVVGNGLVDYCINSFGFRMLLGIIFFIACCIAGVASSHRSFTHSILGHLLFSTSAWLIYPQLGYSVFVAIGSHIILDLFNRRGIKLLFPLKKPELCFNLCESCGKANDILGTIGSVACVLLIPYFAIQSLSSASMPSLIEQGLINGFERYLIFINIITFFAFVIDYFICIHSEREIDQDFWHTILDVLALIGGAPGMLLSLVVLGQKIEKCNINMWVISVSLTAFWSFVFLVERNPFNIIQNATYSPIHYRYLLIYLLVINITTIVFFILDLKKHHTKMSGAEMGLLLLSIIGGALGGLLVVLVTGKKANSPAFSFGLPIMIMAQVIGVGYMIIRGII